MRLVPFALLTSLLASSISLAALKPLTKEEQIASASHIFTGRVMELREELIDGFVGGDVFYTATLAFHDIEKGDLSRVVGRTVKVTYSRWYSRPAGWTGNSGQSSLPKIGSTIRVYSNEYEDKSAYSLLEPNGWELVSGHDEL